MSTEVSMVRQPKRHRADRRVAKASFGVTLKSDGFDSPRLSALRKIKAEVIRIGTNGTRKGFKLAERIMQAIPELKEL